MTAGRTAGRTWQLVGSGGVVSELPVRGLGAGRRERILRGSVVVMRGADEWVG